MVLGNPALMSAWRRAQALDAAGKPIFHIFRDCEHSDILVRGGIANDRSERGFAASALVVNVPGGGVEASILLRRQV